MTNFAIATPTGWLELTPGQPVVIGDIATSYASMLAWSPQYRTARGIKPIEETPIPEDKVAVGSSRVEDQNGKPVRMWDLEDAPEPDMPALRADALTTAIEYGNRITQGEISQWAGVEPFSWGLQRDEAAIVRSGGTLVEGAVLPELAADKGVTLAEYADDVWANAMRYQAVLKAAVYLRRTATNTLTDEALDTPVKLADAVGALTVEADALAAQLLGG